MIKHKVQIIQAKAEQITVNEKIFNLIRTTPHDRERIRIQVKIIFTIPHFACFFYLKMQFFFIKIKDIATWEQELKKDLERKPLFQYRCQDPDSWFSIFFFL